MDKIIRSLCLFRRNSNNDDSQYLHTLSDRLLQMGYVIQTRRVCYESPDIRRHNTMCDSEILISIGRLSYTGACQAYDDFISARSGSLHMDLTNEVINREHVEFLMQIIKDAPQKCFEFAFLFNGVPSSPFFPSAYFEREGFSIGLQSTNLAKNCSSLESWFENQRIVWNEVCDIFKSDADFLGIDSSVAPLHSGESSLVSFLTRIAGDWQKMPLSDVFLRITQFIKLMNPLPIGLCGLMLPCLEDYALAEEYQRGLFSIERNVFLSLHSGLGIDTYPIAIDESPESVFKVLTLLQGLSNKYKKCLSARFVSDGKSSIGQMSQFHNPCLKDVFLRPLLV